MFPEITVSVSKKKVLQPEQGRPRSLRDRGKTDKLLLSVSSLHAPLQFVQ
jgi:hypothetical protein